MAQFTGLFEKFEQGTATWEDYASVASAMSTTGAAFAFLIGVSHPAVMTIAGALSAGLFVWKHSHDSGSCDLPPDVPTEGDPGTGLPWLGNPDDWGTGFDGAQNTTSPIVLDLNGDGVKTTKLSKSFTAGVHFNLDAKGFAENTGWVDAQDGLLVRDLDGNGQITSGRELFGNHTLLTQGAKAGKEAANGFEALKELDDNNFYAKAIAQAQQMIKTNVYEGLLTSQPLRKCKRDCKKELRMPCTALSKNAIFKNAI